MSKTIFKANISQEPGKDPVIELLEGEVEVKISSDGVGKYLIEYRTSQAPTIKEVFSEMSDQELIELADIKLLKLCKTGGGSFTMSVPQDIKDDDVIFVELMRRFEDKINETTYTKEQLIDFAVYNEMHEDVKTQDNFSNWFNRYK